MQKVENIKKVIEQLTEPSKTPSKSPSNTPPGLPVCSVGIPSYANCNCPAGTKLVTSYNNGPTWTCK